MPPKVVPFTRSASPNGSCTIRWVGVMPKAISQWPPPPGLLIGPRCRYPQGTGMPAAICSSRVEKLALLEKRAMIYPHTARSRGRAPAVVAPGRTH